MKIGMTYDLRSEYLKAGYSEHETAEFDRDDTITSITEALESLGYETDRIGNARALMKRLEKGDRWDLVFNIAEGLHGIGREAQVPVLLEMYNIPYTFSDPLVMTMTLHKGMTKHVLRDAKVPTSDFIMVSQGDSIGTIPFPPPYFIKPIAEGTGKGITPQSIIGTREELIHGCRLLISEFRQPVLVEPFLTGREFTVGVIGTGKDAKAIGTLEIILLKNAEQNVYSYTNKEYCEELVTYQLVHPKEDPLIGRVEKISLDAWRVLGCRDGGRVDIRCDNLGNPQFMEVNPLAGLHPEHSDLPILCNLLHIPYTELIRQIVESALKRIPQTADHRKGTIR